MVKVIGLELVKTVNSQQLTVNSQQCHEVTAELISIFTLIVCIEIS